MKKKSTKHRETRRGRLYAVQIICNSNNKLYAPQIVNFMHTSGKDKAKRRLKEVRMKELAETDKTKREIIIRILKKM